MKKSIEIIEVYCFYRACNSIKHSLKKNQIKTLN